jgi:serine/threonine-protein kinase RsbW
MDAVSIKVPASPQFLQVVRLVAAGLAARLQFTLDEIEDLKIAVDELVAYLTGPQGRDGTLEVTFTIGKDRIEIHGAGHFASGGHPRTELSEFSRMILATVADSATLECPDGSLRFDLVKSRR